MPLIIYTKTNMHVQVFLHQTLRIFSPHRTSLEGRAKGEGAGEGAGDGRGKEALTSHFLLDTE